MHRARRRLFGVAAAVAAVLAMTSPGMTSPALATPAPATPAGESSCPAPEPGHFGCMSHVRPVQPGLAGGLGLGYTPQDLQSAYALPSMTAGAGHTVAVVVAGGNPTLESDMNFYRNLYGLPECTSLSGCFRIVNEDGLPSPLPPPVSDHEIAESMVDVEMVSAICPLCNILVVEADSTLSSDLSASVNLAANRAPYVSLSYGNGEFDGETFYEPQFNHPGVVIAVATGDFGYGAYYPATSKFVTAVGGTKLERSGDARGWTETAWHGAGSGCSAFIQKPSWEAAQVSGCNAGARLEADVSAVASEETPVAVFGTSGGITGPAVAWGTSVSTPIIAATYALAGLPVSTEYPSSYPHLNTFALNDPVAGSNGSCGAAVLCTAGAGWDGPTGRGTPAGLRALSGLRVQQPANVSVFRGSSVSVPMAVRGGTPPYVRRISPSEVAPGLTFDANTGLLSGTPTFSGTRTFGFRVDDAVGVAHQVDFQITVIDSVLVPDVHGLTFSSAKTRLQNAGLGNVTSGNQVTCEAPPGRVINQQPQPATFVPVGTAANLTLAKAPPPTRPCD